MMYVNFLSGMTLIVGEKKKKKSNKPKDDENTVPVLKEDLYYVIKVRISLIHISFSKGSDFGHNLLQPSDRLYLI